MEMSKLKKVIKGLQIHADGCGYRSHHCDAMECQYRYGDESCDIEEMCRDAIALLKEQDAVEPYQHDAVWLCGNCEKEVVGWDDDIDGKEYRYPFCRQCGQAVKWE